MKMLLQGSLGLCCLLAVGCNPQITLFEIGEGETQLDGAVIQHGGSDFELTVDDDRQALSRVDIDNGNRYIEFDTALSDEAGVPVPTTIATSQSKLEIDPQSSTATLTVDVPFSGEQTFDLEVDDTMALLGLTDRSALQNRNGTPCLKEVGRIDDFCEIFQANAEDAQQMVVDLALEYAAESGLSPALNGMVEGIVRDFFDVMNDFCDAWTTVRDGDDETLPVDPCNLRPEV